MFNGSNCVRKSQLSGILTEPLNPQKRRLKREPKPPFIKPSEICKI